MKSHSQEDVGKIEIVVIFLGSNDASIASKNPEQAVPLEEFGENLLKIVSVLLSKVGVGGGGSGGGSSGEVL